MCKGDYQLSPRIRLTAGDPVRVAGRRGLYRFVCAYEWKGQMLADLVGPIGGAEGMRTVPATELKSAGRTKRDAVAMSPEAKALSRQAQERRKQ